MANNKSAKKRIRINKRNSKNNKFYKSSIKSLIKKFRNELDLSIKESTINQKNPTEKKLKQYLSSLYSMIDKSVKRDVFHKNKAARQKSKLANYLKFTLIDIII